MVSALRANYAHPSMVELNQRFSEVAYDFQRRPPTLRYPDLAYLLSLRDHEVKCVLIHTEFTVTTNLMLRYMGRNEVRPALYQELLCFAQKYPDTCQQLQIVALGSVTTSTEYKIGAVVLQHGTRLTHRSTDKSWDWMSDPHLFLAVQLEG